MTHEERMLQLEKEHEERMLQLQREREEIDARFDSLMERSNKASTIEEFDTIKLELDKLALDCIKKCQSSFIK